MGGGLSAPLHWSVTVHFCSVSLEAAAPWLGDGRERESDPPLQMPNASSPPYSPLLNSNSEDMKQQTKVFSFTVYCSYYVSSVSLFSLV